MIEGAGAAPTKGRASTRTFDPAPERARPPKVRRRPLRRRIYKRVLAWGILGCVGVLRSLPAFVAYPIGRFAALVGYRFSRETLVARHNVRRAFPDWTDAEREALVRATYESLGRMAIELLQADKHPLVHLSAIEVDGLHHLHAAHEMGRGIVYITGHIGNWELMALKVATLGIKVNVIATEVRYAALNEAVIAFRGKHNINTIVRGSVSSTKEMLAAFRRNEILGMLIDHDTRVPSVEVPFFGHPARTPVGAAELAIRFGAPAVCGFLTRTATGHRLIFTPPILPPTEILKGEHLASAARELTAVYTRAIEDHVRAHPTEWAWMHRRWPVDR